MKPAHRIQRRRSVLVAAVAAVAAGVSAGTACSVERTLPAPWCDDDESSALIVAQSVRSATQVPCFTPLPAGWSISTVRVNEHHTVVTIDSDRAGEGAAVLRLEDGCDVTQAVSAPSDQPAADRYDRVDQVSPSFEGSRFYVFPGGCVSWTFDFDSGVSATEAVAIGNTLTLFSRQELNDIIRETFIDREF